MSNQIVEKIKPSSKKNIDIEELLDFIEAYIKDHAILPKGACTALTLWIVGSYLINSFRIFPKVVLTSPQKRCGKSTVLDLIDAFSFKSLLVSNMSPATIFRVIEKHQPTLLIDEADTFIKGGDKETVGIINSGHAQNRAYVMRCEGDNHDPKKYSTWTPMVLASIGDLQTTIMDRSIVIYLKRKSTSETVTTLPSNLSKQNKKLREKLLKWSIDEKKTIKSNLHFPNNLGDDRAVDNWTPLFTIAQQISKKWLKKCNEAFIALSTKEPEEEISTLLLNDIRSIFKSSVNDKISSKDLITELNKDQDKPWCEYRSSGQLTQNTMAVILKPFGIRPKSIRVKKRTLRGYTFEQFKDAFKRYIPEDPL